MTKSRSGRLLKNELTRKGYSVSVAADGGEALRLLCDSAFDAILLDVVMPGMDGLSLMKTLKEDSVGAPDHRAHRQGHGRDRGGGHEERGLSTTSPSRTSSTNW